MKFERLCKSNDGVSFKELSDIYLFIGSNSLEAFENIWNIDLCRNIVRYDKYFNRHDDILLVHLINVIEILHIYC